jgi:hypothetical protein
MQLLSFPKEVIAHILSFLGARNIYRLHNTAKTIRKHLKKTRLTHKAQATALGLFSQTGPQIRLDSPIVIGFTRFWQMMGENEQECFKRWVRGNADYAPGNQLGSVCLMDNGLCYVSKYAELAVQKLYAPIPYNRLLLPANWAGFVAPWRG